MTCKPPRWSGLLWVVGLWLILLPVGVRFLRDPGTLWHSAVGSRILASGEMIRVDPYTCSFGGERWTAQWWFGEIVIAGLDQFDGLDALLIASTALAALIFGSLAARIHAAGWHPILVALILGLGVAASATHFHARPLLATMAGLALTAVILTDVEAGRRRASWLFVLVPVFWVWGQIHGGVLGGVGTVALVGLGWVVACRNKPRATPPPNPLPEAERGDRKLPCPVPPLRFGEGVRGWGGSGPKNLTILGVIVLALLCFVQLLGPYGPALPRAWYDVLKISELPDVIREHAPPRFDESEGWTLAAGGACYLLALFSVPVRQWRATWLVALVWLVLAFMRVRNAPLFVVTALAALPDLLGRSRWVARLAARGSDLYTPAPISRLRPSWRWAVYPAIVAFALIAWRATGHGDGRRFLDAEVFPVEANAALLELEQNNPDGVNVFCEYTYGGYLIRYHPALRPVIDDRCELFGGDFLREFVKAEGDPARAEAYVRAAIDRYHLEAAVVRTGGNFDRAFGGLTEWHLMQDTTSTRVYRR